MILQDKNYNGGKPELLEATVEELMELYKTLEAPTMEEMTGEFNSVLLPQSTKWDYLVYKTLLDAPIWPGIWIGKAFRPLADKKGRGYNTFRKLNGKLKLAFPMRTYLAPSRYDGKESFQLVYRPFWSLYGMFHMVDEVRKLDENRYLLVGTYGFTKKWRMRPAFILLEGPVRPYRKDIGVPRYCNIKKEIPNWKRKQ